MKLLIQGTDKKVIKKALFQLTKDLIVFAIKQNIIDEFLKQELDVKYQKQIESFNNARNCLVHTNGIVTPRHCNNTEKDKLTIFGNRFKMFFKKGDEETIAEIGKTGPENAALLLGAEEFHFQVRVFQFLGLFPRGLF